MTVKDIALAENKMIYTLKNGREMVLTINMVRNYLVSGRADLATDQEIVFFMHMCKARRLNPFLRECWLIKYSPNDPAQIVEAIQHKRNRARNHPDCRGWRVGIIYLDKDGDVKESRHPFVPEGCRLMAGYFETNIPKWDEPFRHEVALQTVVGRKRDGSLTTFWQEGKQAQMLMKVAESQGLGIVFPDPEGSTLIEEEVNLEPHRDDIVVKHRDLEPYQLEDNNAPTPQPEPVEEQQDEPMPETRPNYFDNPMAFTSQKATPFYVLIMLGRGVEFRPHAIICSPKHIDIGEEVGKVYAAMRKSHPDAWGTLDDARPESKEIIVNALISKLGLERDIADTLVMGTDFWEGTLSTENVIPALTELPGEPELDGPARGLYSKMRKEMSDKILIDALNALGLEDWPKAAGEMLQVYEMAKKLSM